MQKFLTAGVVAIVAALAISSTASADVLYEPNGNTTVGGCITMTAWYQSFSGGSRYISAAVYKNGRGVSRRVTMRTSSKHWRSKMLMCPDWPGRYTVKYWAMGITWTDTVRVGSGD